MDKKKIMKMLLKFLLTSFIIILFIISIISYRDVKKTAEIEEIKKGSIKIYNT